MGQQLARESPRGQVKRLHIPLKSMWAAQISPGGEGIRVLHEGESRIVCRRALGRAGCSSPAEGGQGEGTRARQTMYVYGNVTNLGGNVNFILGVRR
jgi:hypothetical protein